MKAIKTVLIILFYALSNNGFALSWKEKCTTIKRNYLNNKGLNITFSPLPKINTQEKYYVLKWNTINVPIPKGDYKDIFVSQHVSGKYELVLRSGAVTINLVLHKNELVHDVFATSTVTNTKIITSKAGIKRTKTMFSGPVRHSNLIILGYRTAPKNLKCKKSDKNIDAGKLMALILKKPTGPNQLISVHQWRHSKQSWLSKSISSKNLIYSAYLIKKNSSNIIQQINYTVPINLKLFSLIYTVDRIDHKLELTPPKWLKLLNRALQSNSKNQWEKYISYAKKTTLSRRSIQFTIKNLKLEK